MITVKNKAVKSQLSCSNSSNKPQNGIKMHLCLFTLVMLRLFSFQSGCSPHARGGGGARIPRLRRCWYFDDQFMSGWAGPCVWTHFYWFLLKTVQLSQSRAKNSDRFFQGGIKNRKRREEQSTGDLWQLGRYRKEMYQKAFCPIPPHSTTTSTRLVAKSTNYGLVVGEEGAWQQLLRWPSLSVNIKILLPPHILTPFSPPHHHSTLPEAEDGYGVRRGPRSVPARPRLHSDSSFRSCSNFGY